MKSLREFDIRLSDEIDIELCSRWYYNKGYALLRMIEHMITRAEFQHAVRKYLDKFKYRSVTLNDFWTMLQLFFDFGKDSIYIYKEMSIEDILETWLTERYYPIVDVLHVPQKNVLLYTVTRIDSTMQYTWEIPITCEIYAEENMYRSNCSNLILNAFGNIKLLDSFDFVLFNVKQAGYYRVNYDERTWLRIIKFLNGETYHEMHALNRARLIDDAYYLMTNGFIVSPIFWQIIKHLQFDKNYIAWYTIFNILSNVWPVLNHPNTIYMKNIFIDMLNGILQELEFVEKDDDDNMSKALRLLAARWACKLGHIQCRVTAMSSLLSNLTDPKFKFQPWWKDWIYCAGMMMGTESMSNRLFEIYNNTKDVNYKKYLCCAEDIEILMQNVANLWSFTPTQDERMHLNRIITKKLGVVEYIIENYFEIHHSWWNDTSLYLNLIGDMMMNVYFNDDFEKIVNFAEQLTYVNESRLIMSEIFILKHGQKQRIRKMEDTFQLRALNNEGNV
ncbi:aminopeptidase N isoform X2 [Harpegnathos saltator]|nr:aminopeptidase N isoform X2 [Harpegnathos saltator]